MEEVYRKINRELFEDHVFTQIIEKKNEYERSTLLRENQMIWVNPEDYYHLLSYLSKNQSIPFNRTSTEVKVCGITVACDRFGHFPVEERNLVNETFHVNYAVDYETLPSYWTMVTL